MGLLRPAFQQTFVQVQLPHNLNSHQNTKPYSILSSGRRRGRIAITASAKMVKAIRVHELGGPEVLKWEDVEIGDPKEGEIRVKNKAIGLNFIDVYFRTGVYTAPTSPFTPGT